MPNIFDPLEIYNESTQQKLKETKNTSSRLIGKIKYFTINSWSEHRVDRINDIDYVNQIFSFIEEAVSGFTSCLITSVTNKCCTVVCAILYLMKKYNWNVHRSFEYINGRKANIQVTKTILKQLHELEGKLEKNL